MNINKNNYEAFFLCYADGELSAADRLAVEKFVTQNPELEQEFSLTLASVLPAVDLHFTDTAFLLKSSAASENMQEDMLLHLDGELKTEKAVRLDAVINAESLLAKEWVLLNKTKLPEEKILFVPKESLYRYEEVKVSAFPFWRIAAAAILLGICTIGGYKILHEQEPGVENKLAVVPQKQETENPENHANARYSSEKNKTTTPKNDAVTGDNVNTSLAKTHKAITSSPTHLQQDKINNAVANNEETALAQTQMIKKNVNRSPSNSENSLQNNNASATNAATGIKEVNKKIQQINMSVPNQALADINEDILVRKEIIDIDLSPRRVSTKATTASLKEEDNSSTTRIFYFDTKDLKNTKAGTIFKRIGGIINKKNKIVNNKALKIANFNISL